MSAAFSQVGEFSFILGTVARSLGLINDAGWNALVAASIVSIALNPSIYRWARRWSVPGAKAAPVVEGPRPAVDPNLCILVGYGPVGKIVHQLLVDRGTAITVIDINLATVRRLRAEGHAAVYGDVLRMETLDEASIATAGSLIISADIEDAAEVVRQARLLNPDIRVLARCAHLRMAPDLKRAGANIVVTGEAEVGVALAEAVAVGDKMAPDAAAEYRQSVRGRLYDLQKSE